MKYFLQLEDVNGVVNMLNIILKNFLKEFLGEKLFAIYQKNALMKINILEVFELLKKKLILKL